MSRSKDRLSIEKRKKRNKAASPPRRPYRLKERARRLEETRLRITEALVELHGTVGPARTSVSEVAKRAGVRRMTVYNHFPDELAMIDACSSHWSADHPLPDPRPWARIEIPDERVRRGLEELYRYYRDQRDMVGNFLRDAALVPPLAHVLARKWFPALRAMEEALAAGRDTDAEASAHTRVALRLALDFTTWRILADSGLDDAAAARLAAAMVAAAARSD